MSKYFLKNILFKRIALTISVLALIFTSGYLIFSAMRSLLSTEEGIREFEQINQPGIMMANLDPASEVDMDFLSASSMQEVYDDLNAHYRYALYTDGFMVKLPNQEEMEVSVAYMNSEYNQLNPFPLEEGEPLSFDYRLQDSEAIPVLVGKGLSEEYPVGTVFHMHDPVLERDYPFKVQGVLRKNASHSNFYAISSKQYYNFSLVVPVTEEFLEASNVDLKINGLMDLILLDTNREEAEQLGRDLQEQTRLKFNFYSQEENTEDFNRQVHSSLSFLLKLVVIMFVAVACVSVWNLLVGLQSMIKEVTINLLAGMSYSQLRKTFYQYFGLLSCVAILIVFIITIFSRQGIWMRHESIFATYGFCGLIAMDWLSLLVVGLSDLLLSLLVVEIAMRRVKKVPISLGVLQ